MTDQCLPFVELARPFAQALLCKRPLAQTSKLSDRQRARVLESMSDDLKKLCDVVTPGLKPPMVSLRARKRAEEAGIDLCRQTWHSQPRFDMGRKVFHLEHIAPIKSLRTIALDAASVDELVDLL